MALTIANECRQAALNGILGLLSGGNLLLTNTAGGAGSELAQLPISGGTASATNANPSSGTLTLTADTSVTAGTILGFALRTSGNSARISGNVATSASDLNVTDNVIPSGATEVSCSGGLTITLSLS